MIEKDVPRSKEKKFGHQEKQPIGKKRFSIISLPPDLETVREDQEADWTSLQQMHEVIACDSTQSLHANPGFNTQSNFDKKIKDVSFNIEKEFMDASSINT